MVQSIKDHITKPTAMARGRVAHLIEWKGWSVQQSGWELSPGEEEHYSCLPDELREARFAAGERGRCREGGHRWAGSAGVKRGLSTGWRMGRALGGVLPHLGREAHVGIECPLPTHEFTEPDLAARQVSLSSLLSRRPL